MKLSKTVTERQSLAKYNVISKALRDGYTYTKSVYKGSRVPMTITCSIHGDFEQTPSSHFDRKSNCPACKLAVIKTKRALTTKQFIERSNKAHNYKYTYDKVIYDSNHTKVIITCPVHGDFTQQPSDHMKGIGCSKCRDILTSTRFRDTLETFIEKANEVHKSRYSYKNTVYTKSADTITITCPYHGDFTQRASDHMNGNGCQICGNNKKRAKYFSKPTVLYYIYLPKYNLYKIGITLASVGIRKRYQSEPGLEYIILSTKVFLTGKQPFHIEQEIINKYKDFSYTGDKFFKKGGESECFTTNILNNEIKI